MEELTFEQREILARAQEIILNKGYEDTCLEAGICPECGRELHDNRSPHTGSTTYTCMGAFCKFRVVR